MDLLRVPSEQRFFDRRTTFRGDIITLDTQIIPLYDVNSPHITAEEITDGLNQLRKAYGDDGLRKFLFFVAEEDEGLSDSRKSWILGLGHFVLYNVDTPSGFILLAMNFANRSGKQEAITQWSEWLKRHFNIPNLEMLLNVLGKDAVESRMIKEGELQIMRQQLIVPIVRAQVPFSFEE